MQRLAFPPPDRSSHLVPIRMSGEPLISGVDSSYPLGGLSPLTHFVLKWWEVEVNNNISLRSREIRRTGDAILHKHLENERDVARSVHVSVVPASAGVTIRRSSNRHSRHGIESSSSASHQSCSRRIEHLEASSVSNRLVDSTWQIPVLIQRSRFTEKTPG